MTCRSWLPNHLVTQQEAGLLLVADLELSGVEKKSFGAIIDGGWDAPEVMLKV